MTFGRIGLLIFKGIFTLSFCCGAGFTAVANAEESALQGEIVRLQALSETQRDQAINQLQTLLQKMPTNAAPADRRELMLALIPLYIDGGNKEQARELNASLAKQGQHIQDQVSIVMAMTYEARLLNDEGRTGESLEIIEQALAIVEHAGNNRLSNQVYSMAGELYSKVGNFQIAMRHELKALDALGDSSGQQSDLRRARALNNISRLYLRLKDPKMALAYNAKAAELVERTGSSAFMANLANNRGYAYADQDQWAPAISAYKKALKIARDVGDSPDEILALNNLADAALNQMHYPDCVLYARESIAVAQKNRKEDLAATALGNLGVCHIDMGAVAQGAAEIKHGIEFLRKAKALPQVELMLDDLATAYKKASLYREALEAKEEQQKLATELFQTERDRAIMELQARFDVSQRQKEIGALEQKNRLQSAEIENKSLQRVIAILATIVAVAISIAIFLLYRKIRESNRRLNETNVKLEHQSTHDPLTGLFNRRAFEDYLKSQGQSHAADKKALPSVLVLLDIDHFKHINDTYGHAIGDLVLVELGKRLHTILREKDMLMRWGGEEFLIYLHGLPLERISHVIERTLTVVGGTPVEHNDNPITVTISIGYILIPLPGIEETELDWEKALQLSDVALYMAKSGGRNQAIGIVRADGSKEQIAALVASDLQGAAENGVVTLQRIAGPVATQMN